MRLPLLYYPDERLRHVAVPVPVETSLHMANEVAEAMLEVMLQHNGIGLAANQVGSDYRIVVLYPPLVLINPEVKLSGKRRLGEEGCLSFPGLFGDVLRYDQATVSWVDRTGCVMSPVTWTGQRARVIQHEIDHLNGVLFTDKMTTASKLAARSWLKQAQAEYQERQ